MTQPPTLAKYVSVDSSSARLARIWAGASSRLELRPRPLGAVWRWAGVSLLVLGVAGTTWTLAQSRVHRTAWKGAVLETAAQGMQIRLADDSRLELAEATRVEMLRDDSQATAVRLAQGRVTCDLPKPRRPFSVLAGDVEVRVTGTRFSVERDAARGHVDVAVERGAVALRVGAESTPSRTIRAGERWSAAEQGAIVTTPGATTERTLGSDPRAMPSVSAGDEPNPPMPADSAPAIAGSSGLEAAREAPRAVASNELGLAKELFDRGNLARRAGDAQAAAQAYQALLNRFPGDARSGIAALELGRLRMGPLRDPAGATAALRAAITLLPGSALREDAMARLVEAYAASGQTAACRTARTAYLRDYPRGVHSESLRRQCGGP